ncbi:C6 transcription factor OefC [Purpureocillium lavendulum]|uniref:C6 transcription factor OefC n=1 Tax=Purpureocillium lavendulum TaxID=1247861 RepID=A0AB34FQP0_9HYPO|nr:C6 transcription factor OefC [Purpureocillium lavendulum]
MVWPPEKTMHSGDVAWDAVVLPSPSPTESAWRRGSLPIPIPTGQISPVSSAMEAALDGSSVPTTVPSASSSCTDSWSIGFGGREDGDEDAQWDHWERGSDDALTVPKLEPSDDNINLDDVKAAPHAPGPAGDVQVKQKRPRGRPRKHPLTPTVSASKITKGRSKTGCITCRKRKKKCDEAKPRCMNCEKNAVVCEGYHEKQIWRSGRERAEEERLRRESLPTVTMQPIFLGVETVEDKIFWKHYINHFSNVLTVEGEAKNAFKDIILQLANQHQGLMHSILALSSRHIDFDSPYGSKILQDNAAATRESIHQRAEYHHGEALKRFYDDMNHPITREEPEHETVLAAHLPEAHATIPPEDSAFYTFISEFFQYHIYADDLLWHPETMTDRLSSPDWEPTMPIAPPRLLGVADGLFGYLSQITSIRNTIRANMAASVDPLVDYITLFKAVDIDAAIREWSPRWPPGDSRDRVAPLYKQMMWVYLFRSIYPPSTPPARRSTLGSLPTVSVTPAAPPLRRASMAATVRSGTGSVFSDPASTRSCPPSRNPSRTSSMHETDAQSLADSSQGSSSHRRSSPPPTRRPAHDDRRITLAVEESLSILESFKPSDPAQTLLLIPCLIIGTACFDPSQRDRVRTAIRVVRGYTGLRNCDRVRELLEAIWAHMDKGDWVSVWDWQGVARNMGLDFICT